MEIEVSKYNYQVCYKNDSKIYSIWDNTMEIMGGFIFSKMKDIGWEVCTYSYNENYIDLYGSYPRSKIIEIKKFFHDEYPYTSNIEPRKYGLRIFFKIKVILIYNSFNKYINAN